MSSFHGLSKLFRNGNSKSFQDDFRKWCINIYRKLWVLLERLYRCCPFGKSQSCDLPLWIWIPCDSINFNHECHCHFCQVWSNPWQSPKTSYRSASSINIPSVKSARLFSMQQLCTLGLYGGQNELFVSVAHFYGMLLLSTIDFPFSLGCRMR